LARHAPILPSPAGPLFDRARDTPAGENAPEAREREKSRAELFLEAGIDKLLSEMDTTAAYVTPERGANSFAVGAFLCCSFWPVRWPCC